jgi:DNA polymerase elongation subunit (family B)
MNSIYALSWDLAYDAKQKSHLVNIETLSKDGKDETYKLNYNCWFGALLTCDDIDSINNFRKELNQYFPCTTIVLEKFERVDKLKTHIHNLKNRFSNDNWTVDEGYFYKVYVTGTKYTEVAKFLDSNLTLFSNILIGINLTEDCDFEFRLSLDLYELLEIDEYKYAWYECDCKEKELFTFLKRKLNDKSLPPMRVVSFDLETIPLKDDSYNYKSRVPDGSSPLDRIVMISAIYGQINDSGDIKIVSIKEYVLVLEDMPFDINTDGEIIKNYLSKQYSGISIDLHFFKNELSVIKRFLLDLCEYKCHILTGYNILNFDLPCLLSRVIMNDYKLGTKHNLFSSMKIGNELVIKLVNTKHTIDYYKCVQNYHGYGLPSFKLSKVAAIKLKNQTGPDNFGISNKLDMSVVCMHRLYQTDWTKVPRNSKCFTIQTDREEFYSAIESGLYHRDIKMQDFGTFIEMLNYCIIDSLLIFQLMNVDKSINLLTSISNTLCSDLEKCLYRGKNYIILSAIESMSLKCGFFFIKKKWIQQNMDKSQHDDLQVYISNQNKNKKKILNYQGALTYCDESKFIEDVAIYDFTSLYPSCMMQFNLSHDMCATMKLSQFNLFKQKYKDDPSFLAQFQVVPYQMHEDDIFQDFTQYTSQKETYQFPDLDNAVDHQVVMVSWNKYTGIYAEIVSYFFNKRQEHLGLMKLATDPSEKIHHSCAEKTYKLYANSAYGITGTSGYSNSAFANLSVGASITCFARYMLLAAFEYCYYNLDNKPVYCDTDSIFIKGIKDDAQADGIRQELNKFINFPQISIKLEEIIPTMYLMSKKKYLMIHDDKIKSKGFEVQSTDLVKQCLQLALDASISHYKEMRNICLRIDGMPEMSQADKDSLKAEAFKDKLKHRPELDILKEIIFNVRNKSLMNMESAVLTRKVKDLHSYSANCHAPHVKLLKELVGLNSMSLAEGDVFSFVYVDLDIPVDQCKQYLPMTLADAQNRKLKVSVQKVVANQQKNMLSILSGAFCPPAAIRNNELNLKKEFDKICHTIKCFDMVLAELSFRLEFNIKLNFFVSKHDKFWFYNKRNIRQGIHIDVGGKRKQPSNKNIKSPRKRIKLDKTIAVDAKLVAKKTATGKLESKAIKKSTKSKSIKSYFEIKEQPSSEIS